MSDDQNPLADGIVSEAQATAEKLLTEWQNSQNARQTSLGERLAKLEADTSERIERERRRIEARTDSQIALEERRARLRLRDSVNRTVEQGAVEKIAELMTDASYEAILSGWILESCVGLGAEVASVNCSLPEKAAVARVLDAAVKEASSVVGRSIRVTPSEEAPLAEQGIVLISEDGRTGFGNRVLDRIRRQRVRIRRMVYDRLFGDERNAGTDRRTD